MGRAGSGGHSSGGHSSSRSSSGHSFSSGRAGGSSYGSHSGGGYHGGSFGGGGVHVHNTYIGGGYGGRYYSDDFSFWSILLFTGLLFLIMFGTNACSRQSVEHNQTQNIVVISDNTVREKLTGTTFDANCVIDELGWFDSTTQTGKSLKDFYDATGIQPYIVLRAYDSSLTSNDEKIEYAENYYEENIDNEYTFLFMYFAEKNTDEDVGYSVYVSGKQVDSIMDSSAIDIFWNNLDKYWFSDETTDNVFIKTFNDTSKTIMKNSTDNTDKSHIGWYIVLGIILVGGIAYVVVLKVKNKKEEEENKKAEAELIQRKVEAGTFKLSDLDNKDKDNG